MKKNKYLIIIVLSLMVFNSCKKQIGNSRENGKINENLRQNYSRIVENSVFNYPIQKYNNIKSFLKNLDNTDSKSENDFYSLYDYYTDAQEIFDSLGVEGLKEKGFNLNYFEYDTSGIFELKILDQNLAKQLSPEGFIQFGDTIMKVNPNNLIFIKNSDYSAISEIKNNDFSNKDIKIVRQSKSFPIVKKEAYYDNGWNYGCHRIYLQRWYRNYEYYLRAGVTISYYTRIYKRNILLHKRLVWIKKDKADLYIHGSCDKIRAIIYYEDDGIDTEYYYTKNLFEKFSNCNHISMSKNPTNLSLSFWGLSSILNLYIYNYKMSYLTPIKNGIL